MGFEKSQAAMPGPRFVFSGIRIGLLFAAMAWPMTGSGQTTGGQNPNIETPDAQSSPQTPPLPAASTSNLIPPPEPVSPFGPAPGVFPGLSPAPAPQVVSPFGVAPGTFPNLEPSPSPTTPQATSPFGAAPGVFPDLETAPPGTAPNAQTGPASPFGATPGVFPGLSSPPAASAGAEQTAPTAPEGTQNAFPTGETTPTSSPPPELAAGYGYGTPAAPNGTTPTLTLPASAPSPTGLPPLVPGAVPIQAGDLRAPPILISPVVQLFEGYTDNPSSLPQGTPDSITRAIGSANISFDTVRIKGQLSNTIDYDKYARDSSQTSLTDNLLGMGLVTVVPNQLFIDTRTTITQLSKAGGVGFAPSSVIPQSQQTQAFLTSISPILRESFGDWLDTELRYNYGMNSFSNGSLLGGGSTSAGSASAALSNSTQNEATLSLATGRAITEIASKLTLDAVNVGSQSNIKSTQLRAYDDLEYAFNTKVAAIARIGYDDIRYPLLPAATTIGPIWLVGGRLSPAPGDYLTVRYGLQDGIYGANGLMSYQVTARTKILASLQNGLSSSQQQLQASLGTSALDSNGTVVNQYSGLPSALSNPEFGYTSDNIYRTKQGLFGIQTTLDRDAFGILATYNRQVALGPTTAAEATSGTNTSYGANINWSRSLTPLLTSNASLGYARALVGDEKTLTADFSLTYTLSPTLDGIIHYQFINVNASNVAVVSTGSYRSNLIEVGITRRF
jgi:uncharacterized protein (PEP-CTERM system associated)